MSRLGIDAENLKTDSWWKATQKALTRGVITTETGKLWNTVRRMENKGNKAAVEYYREQIDALEQEAAFLQDPFADRRRITTKMLTAVAKSAPYMAYITGATLAGTLVAPGVGTAAGFIAGWELNRAQEYGSMIKAGIRHETADTVSNWVGAVQSATEILLGRGLKGAGQVLKIAGKKVGGSTLATINQRVSRALVSKIHLSGIPYLLAKAGLSNVFEWTSEGAEEVLQALQGRTGLLIAKNIQMNKLGQALRNPESPESRELLTLVQNTVLEQMIADMSETAALETKALLLGYGVEVEDWGQVKSELSQEFEGGFLSAILLDVIGIPAGLKMTFKTANAVKQEARHNPVKADFLKNTEQTGIPETIRAAAWEKTQDRLRREEAKAVEEIKATRGLGEGYAEVEYDEEAGKYKPLGELYHRPDGRLYTELDERKRVFKAGDARVHSRKNLDAHIEYHEEEGKIVIDRFQARPDRDTPEYRREFFRDFAESFAGREPVWNPATDAEMEIRADLARHNPNGEQAGLRYYLEEDAEDTEQARYRNRVIETLSRYFPKSGNTEHAVMAAEWEHFAEQDGLSLEEYVNREFGGLERAFINRPNGDVTAEEKKGGKVKGAVWFESGFRDARATVYVTQNSDLSTFIHEMGHIYRRRLRGEALKEAERIWGVQGGKWSGPQEEQFTEDLERWRREGRAPRPEMESFFRRFAEFLKKIYNAVSRRGQVSDEAREFFANLYAGDYAGEQARAETEQGAGNSEQGVRNSEQSAGSAREAQDGRQSAPTGKDTAEARTEVPQAAQTRPGADTKPDGEQPAAGQNTAENERRIERARWEGAERSSGAEDQITVETGETLRGHYELGEAGISTPSVDPEKAFTPHGDFPVNANGASMNVGRDYTEGFAREAVERMAADFDQRGEGIVVDENGVTASGNNRDISRRVAARKGTDGKYTAYLQSRPERWGFTREDIARYRHPTLYFVTAAPAAYTPRWFDRFNRSGTKSLSPVENAVKMSYLVDRDMVNEFSAALREYESAADLYEDVPAATGIFKSLLKRGIVTENSYPEYVETVNAGGKQREHVTSGGKDFLESVMLGAVLDEDSIRALALVPKIRGRLVNGLAALVDNAAPGEYGVIPEINRAVATAAEVQTNPKKYKSIKDYAGQSELDLGQRVSTDIEIELASRLLERNEYGFADMTGGLNAVLREEHLGQGDLFSPTGKDDILRRYLNVKAWADEIRSENGRVIESKSASVREKARAALENAGLAKTEQDGTRTLFSLEEDGEHPAAELVKRALRIADTAERRRVVRDITDLYERYAGTAAEYRAPNGKPSLLLEALGEERGKEAWYAVRTPGFKEWFGDWEATALIEMAEKVWAGDKTPARINFAPSGKLRAELKSLLGNDVQQIFITDSDIRHIKSRHAENREKQGQLNITPEDIALIPFIVNEFDTAVHDETDRQGNFFRIFHQ
jgi:hypothetical protein